MLLYLVMIVEKCSSCHYQPCYVTVSLVVIAFHLPLRCLYIVFGRSFFDPPSSMSERRAKLRRLDDFRRHVPSVSASALSAVLREALSDIPEVVHRQALQEARDLKFDENTPYGKAHSTLSLQARPRPHCIESTTKYGHFAY